MPRIARWFLDIVLDNETLRWWSGHGSIAFEGQTYTGLGTRWKTPESLKRSASLKSEKVELEFDSARQTVNGDPIGHLLDQKWRRRQVRLRRLVWNVGETPDAATVLADERGRIRNLSDELQAGKPPKLTMEIESGALAYLERRAEFRTSAGQKRVFPADKGFDLIAKLEGKTLRWRTKETKAGNVQIQLQEKYEPVARQLCLGRFVTSGSFVAAFVNDQIYDQDRHLQRVYALADHRIAGIDKVWINGDLVHDAPLVHGVRTLVRLPGDKNEDRCWVTFYDGRPDQVADPYLVENEPSWTADHRLRGVAYMIVEHWWDSDLPGNFSYRFGGQGALLYDRRKDDTAGGTGSQRWDDPSTWAYSTNAMVAADHYRSGMRVVSGSSALWFGVGEAPDAVPYSEFAAIADHCDEDVALKNGGTQKRYEVNGVLSSDASHNKILQKFADQMAAQPIDQGGRIAFRLPIVRTPVVTLTDGDLARGSKSKIDPGGRIDDMINTMDVQFINPANDYKKDDAPRAQVAAYVDDDNGEIADSRDLDLENSSERGQRIGYLSIEDSRRILQQEETYTGAAKDVQPGDWFNRASDLRGFPAGKMFIADKVDRFIDGSVEIQATEVFPDQLVWLAETATDQPDVPDVPPTGAGLLPVPSLTVEPVAILAGDATLPAVRITHANYQNFVGDEIVCELGFSNGQNGATLGINGQSQFARIPGDRETVDAFVGLPPSTAWAIRFRAKEGERSSEWSDFQEFYSTSIYRVGDVSTVGGRTAEEVINGIDSNAASIARETLLRATWSAANQALLWIGGETIGSVAQQALEANSDSALSLTLLGARNGTDTAFILDSAGVVVPASGEPGSSAVSLQAFRTQHDQNIADITWLLESVDGASAQATLALDVNGYVIGFKIDNSGTPQTSSFIIIADNFAIASPGNGLGGPFYPFSVVDGIVFMDEVWVRRIKADSIETEALKDNSITERMIVSDGSSRTLNTSAAYGEIESFVYDKASATSAIDVRFHVKTTTAASSDLWGCFVRVKRNGVEVAAGEFAHLLQGRYLYSLTGSIAVTGVPAGNSTWSVDMLAQRGVGGGTPVSDASCVFSQISVEEVKK